MFESESWAISFANSAYIQHIQMVFQRDPKRRQVSNKTLMSLIQHTSLKREMLFQSVSRAITFANSVLVHDIAILS